MRVTHHHVTIGVTVVAVVVGGFLGVRSAGQMEAQAAVVAPRPETTDPRHPVEVYLVPPFLRETEVVLQSLRIPTAPEDRLRFRPGVDFGIGGQLIIERAQIVTVRDANEERQYRTWTETVSQLLAEQGIDLGEQDRVVPALDQPLLFDTKVVITRVEVTELQKKETIAFKTREEDDPNRPRGERQVKQKGVSGSKTLTYKVRRENGKEVKRDLIKTEVTREPVEEIVKIGSRVIAAGQGKATWYDPPWSGLTAAHNSLPKGTLVDVVNVSNGKRVTVKINDHGIQSNAIIDLSVEAFKELAPLGAGVISVKLEIPG